MSYVTDFPRRLTEQRHSAIGRLQAGARNVGVFRTTINKVWMRYTTGSTRDGPRSGRPRTTTPA